MDFAQIRYAEDEYDVNDADETGYEDDGQGEYDLYEAVDDETPTDIGRKLGITVPDIVELNRERYQGMNRHAKLREGTSLLLPLGKGPVWYYTRGSDTPTSVSTKLGLNLDEVMALNIDRLPGLLRKSQFERGTILYLPSGLSFF